MSRRALARLACATAALAALAVPASAGAFYGNAADGVEGAQLISADYGRLEQGDDTTKFAAISADGRFAAIQTRARNFFADGDPDPAGNYRAGGIFRFDLGRKGLEKVADGDLFRESDNTFLRRGASNPSVSADGRFVAFSSDEQLVAADLNDNVDVYVRDMGRAIGDPAAFVLVSARSGGATPASYGPPAFPFPGGNPGAEVSPGVAISADGSQVAFRTEAESDLPAQPGVETPAGQVFVRDLAAQTTTLVTAKRDPGGSMTAEPAGGALGVALSADGTTVAWTGRRAPEQTRFLSGENQDPSFNYYLWRRAPFGPGDATRRITGLADPDDLTCRREEEENPGMVTTFNPNVTGPCYGPLTDQEANRADVSSQIPALSGNGYRVAFLTGAGSRPQVQSGPGLDLYMTDMSPGVSRKQGTVELTRDASSADTATSSPLSSVAMSPDGRYLGIVTSRTQFTLPALRLVGTARTVAGPHELYVVDLQQRTLERAAHSLSGGDIDGGVQDGVTLSDGGRSVAFSSFAGNLFRGDANQRADTFVAGLLPQPGEGGGAVAGGNGSGASSVTVDRAGPRVLVRAKAKAAGVVVLTISVPAAGAIEAVAKGRSGKPPKLRTIATRKTHARGKGSFHVVMRAAPRFRPRLRSGHKLAARVAVTFTPAGGGRKLHASTTVAFSN